MRWIENLPMALIAGFCITVAVPATKLKAEPIVVKYEGPNNQNFKPGKKLSSTSKISLKTGETLTVLDERGTRTLRGPGTFSAASAISSSNVSSSNLASLIKTSSVRRARTGAVRGENALQQRLSPNLWYIDVTKSSRLCVPDFQSLQLWRADVSAGQQTLTIASASGGDATARFGEDRTTVRWPSTVKPVDGGRYSISAPGNGGGVAIEMVKIDVTGEERLDTLASKLFDRGCQAQGELLAETFAQGDSAPVG